MIDLREPKPPAPAEQLEAAERRLGELGHRIPPSYRAFLAEQDGGRPVRRRFGLEGAEAGTGSRVTQFLGVGPVEPPNGNIVDTVELLGDRMLPGVLPIADDPFGNHVCLDTRDGRDGPVLFWDHEREAEPPDESNLSVVAPDLRTFLDGLEEPPPPPEPERRGWRKLLGG